MIAGPPPVLSFLLYQIPSLGGLRNKLLLPGLAQTTAEIIWIQTLLKEYRDILGSFRSYSY